MSNILRAIVLANDVKTFPVTPHTEPEVVFNGMIIVGEFLRKSIMGMKMQYSFRILPLSLTEELTTS